MVSRPDAPIPVHIAAESVPNGAARITDETNVADMMHPFRVLVVSSRVTHTLAAGSNRGQDVLHPVALGCEQLEPVSLEPAQLPDR